MPSSTDRCASLSIAAPISSAAASGSKNSSLRSIHAAGRRVLARRSWRSAARIPDRGRDRQHARHRRGVPVGAKRRLGEAVSGLDNSTAARMIAPPAIAAAPSLRQRGPRRQRRKRRLGKDHQSNDANRRAAHRHRGQTLSQRVEPKPSSRASSNRTRSPGSASRRATSRDGEDDGRDRGGPHRRVTASSRRRSCLISSR